MMQPPQDTVISMRYQVKVNWHSSEEEVREKEHTGEHQRTTQLDGK